MPPTVREMPGNFTLSGVVTLHVIQGGTLRRVPYRCSQQGKWPIGLQRPGPTVLIQPRPCPSFQHMLESLSGYGPNWRTTVLAYGADQALPLIDMIRYETSHSGQLSLAILLWIAEWVLTVVTAIAGEETSRFGVTVGSVISTDGVLA